MIPHRRARIDDAIVELFRPLMAWNGWQPYWGESVKNGKENIAEKTGDMPLYTGVRRIYDGRIYETVENIEPPDPNNPDAVPNAPPDKAVNEDGVKLWNSLMEYPRTDLLPGAVSEEPSLFKFETVQKQYVPWTLLKNQDALPALMLAPGDNGLKPDSQAVGFIDERYPVSVIAVLEETEQDIEARNYLIDQASDMQYSIETLFNQNRSLGVQGVLAEDTRIEGWRNSEESLYPILIVKFRVVVVHRYYATQSV